jgi:hypothetical protein
MSEQSNIAGADKGAGQQRGKPFKKGQSGNPAGRPQGSRHKTTLAMEELLDGEAEKLTRKAVELALAGDGQALRLCIERIIPPRKDRPVQFDMPTLATVADIVPAHAAIAAAVSAGEITPGEGLDCARLIEGAARAIELTDIEQRLAKLESQQKGK